MGIGFQNGGSRKHLGMRLEKNCEWKGGEEWVADVALETLHDRVARAEARASRGWQIDREAGMSAE